MKENRTDKPGPVKHRLEEENTDKPAPVKYKLAKGQKIMIPGLFEVTNKHLENPVIIAAITRHELKTGLRIIGTAIVKA